MRSTLCVHFFNQAWRLYIAINVRVSFRSLVNTDFFDIDPKMLSHVYVFVDKCKQNLHLSLFKLTIRTDRPISVTRTLDFLSYATVRNRKCWAHN